MNDIKKELLFSMVIHGMLLNDKNMYGRGISKKDIAEMVDLGVIEKNSLDEYKFMDVKGLYQYGLKLLSLKQKKEASECFIKCYELDPENLDIKLQYLLGTIKQNDYQNAFKLCEELRTSGNNMIRNDINIYMCLLSVFTDLEPSQALKVKDLCYKDVVLSFSDQNKDENEIRKEIWLSKFTHACNLINKLMREHDEYSVHYETMRTLIVRALDYDRQLKMKILGLAKAGDLDTIKTILQHRNNQRRLSKLENYVMLLVDAIIDMKNTGKIIKPTKVFFDNLYDAILANNFELALKLNNQFLEQNEDDPNEDILHVLLIQINGLIDELRKNDSVSQVDNGIDGAIEIDTGDLSITGSSVNKNSNNETYMDMMLRESEELAYYIKEEGKSLDDYAKRMGLLPRYMLLVKLIYARDYYIEENYPMGDKLIEQVELWSSKDAIVSLFLEQVKFNRDSYKEEKSSYTRKRVNN